MKRLIGSPFHSMHRVLDMLCINLGKTYQQETIMVGSQVISHFVLPTYSLHLQVQWRFTFQDRIILGSRDIYEPFSKNVEDNWDYSPLNRPECESSVFDVVSKRIEKELEGQYIVNCTVSPVGDIQITFSNGYVLDVFIPASYPDEEWRLIDFEVNEQLVFYDVD